MESTHLVAADNRFVDGGVGNPAPPSFGDSPRPEAWRGPRPGTHECDQDFLITFLGVVPWWRGDDSDTTEGQPNGTPVLRDKLHWGLCTVLFGTLAIGVCLCRMAAVATPAPGTVMVVVVLAGTAAPWICLGLIVVLAVLPNWGYATGGGCLGAHTTQPMSAWFCLVRCRVYRRTDPQPV